VFLISILIFTFFLDFEHQALAKRFGGGRSFGSRPSYSRSYIKKVPSRTFTVRSKTSSRKSATIPTRQRSTFPRSGLWGFLGGLAMGGLLGSLFFGGPFHGPNLLDLLIIGGVIFLIFKFMRSKRPAEATSASSYASSRQGPTEYSETAWDNLRTGTDSQVPSEPKVNVPDGFDEEEFLKGAKAAFLRMQESWDKRDLEDIKQFTSPEVFAFIKAQAEEDPHPSKTEILLVNARLLEVREEGETTIASVYFDVLLREDAAQSSPQQVREVWHFSRRTNDPHSTWTLEGIQQLADSTF
jgi:predicted lipid-binding transport protein (Tim44 family)